MPLELSKPMYSIVIPIYKKELVVKESVTTVLAVLDSIATDNYELIAVVDGSPDKSWEILESVHHPRLKKVLLTKNQGKGYAIRHGLEIASGEYLGFIDCGLDINPASLVYIISAAEKFAPDAVLPNRNQLFSTYKSPLYRRLISQTFTLLKGILFDLKDIDTQVGLKLFRGDIMRQLLPHLTHNSWLFDIEILSLMQHKGRKNFVQVPVVVDMQKEDSSQSAKVTSIIKMILGLFALSFKIGRIRYLNILRPRYDLSISK
jgi:dolichyl-phosphate beta-glucosyltransferase